MVFAKSMSGGWCVWLLRHVRTRVTSPQTNLTRRKRIDAPRGERRG